MLAITSSGTSARFESANPSTNTYHVIAGESVNAPTAIDPGDWLGASLDGGRGFKGPAESMSGIKRRVMPRSQYRMPSIGRWIIAAIVTLLISGGCGSDRQASATAVAPSPAAASASPAANTPVPTASQSEAASPNPTAEPQEMGVLRAARLDAPSSLDAIERIRFTVAGVKAAEELLRSGVAGAPRWAAVYVYASAGTDLSVLRGLLGDPDVSIRTMAAAGLVGRGEATGFAPLLAALSESELLTGSVPPEEVREFAAIVLERYTEANLIPTPGSDDRQYEGARHSWQAWLDARAGRLQFDPRTQRWLAP